VYLPNGKDMGLFNPDFEDVLDALELLNQNDLRLVIIGGSPYDDYDDRLKEAY
jgi:uracil DNA glycosylase